MVPEEEEQEHELCVTQTKMERFFSGTVVNVFFEVDFDIEVGSSWKGSGQWAEEDCEPREVEKA